MILRQISTKLKNTYEPSTGLFISRDKIGSGRNWYSYCSNSPLTASDPSGLRPPNDQDHRHLRKLRLYMGHYNSTAEEMDEVIETLKPEINSSEDEDANGDPVNLRTLWWAIDHLDDCSCGTSGCRQPGVGKNRCNAFVYAAYELGSGAAMARRPSESVPFWRSLLGANEFAKPKDLPHLTRVSRPEPGDIVAWGYRDSGRDSGSGHMGLYVGGDVHIYSSSDTVKLGRRGVNRRGKPNEQFRRHNGGG